MIRIGVLSDTHGYLDSKIKKYFEQCDEVWHGGDIGSLEIIDQLNQFKKSRIIFGNIDDHIIRATVKETELFQLEDQKILLTHIAGSFGSYNSKVKLIIQKEKPQVLVCGHSHFLKVAYDHKNQLLYINPGACGKIGFHLVRTVVRFTIESKEIKNLEVIELQPRH